MDVWKSRRKADTLCPQFGRLVRSVLAQVQRLTMYSHNTAQYIHILSLVSIDTIKES